MGRGIAGSEMGASVATPTYQRVWGKLGSAVMLRLHARTDNPGQSWTILYHKWPHRTALVSARALLLVLGPARHSNHVRSAVLDWARYDSDGQVKRSSRHDSSEEYSNGLV